MNADADTSIIGRLRERQSDDTAEFDGADARRDQPRPPSQHVSQIARQRAHWSLARTSKRGPPHTGQAGRADSSARWRDRSSEDCCGVDRSMCGLEWTRALRLARGCARRTLLSFSNDDLGPCRRARDVFQSTPNAVASLRPINGERERVDAGRQVEDQFILSGHGGVIEPQ